MDPNKNLNSFDEMVRQNLEGAEMPAPSGVWEGISAGISGQASIWTVKGILAKFAGIKAAAIIGTAITFTGIGYYFIEPPQNPNSEKPLIQESHTPIPNEDSSEPDAQHKINFNGENDQKGAVYQSGNPVSGNNSIPGFKSGNPENRVATYSNPFGKNVERPLVKNPDFGNDQKPEKENISEKAGLFELGKTTICAGEKVVLRFSQGADLRFFTLHVGDGRAFDPMNKPEFSYPKGGNYKLVLKGKINGESVETERMVSVTNLNIGFNFKDLERGTFQFNSTTPEYDKICWELGDNHAKVCGKNTLSFTFPEGFKKYPVKLWASKDGCRDSIIQWIQNMYTGQKQKDVFVPNIFTPGIKDGKNDTYKILIDNPEKYYLVIQNQKGEVVFESVDVNDEWNGNIRNGNIECFEGWYFYRLTYKIFGEPEKNQTGKLRLN